jgi:hypothetical protein
MKTITLEIIDCLKHFKVWLMLGYFDVSKRYIRSFKANPRNYKYLINGVSELQAS